MYIDIPHNGVEAWALKGHVVIFRDQGIARKGRCKNRVTGIAECAYASTVQAYLMRSSPW
jgi:hypothetical protein